MGEHSFHYRLEDAVAASSLSLYISSQPPHRRRRLSPIRASSSSSLLEMVGLSIGEKHFIQGGIAQDIRSDGRKRLTPRPINVKTGVISHANGSTRVRMGATDVIASVKAELGRPTALQPDKGKVFINVDCSPTAAPMFEVCSTWRAVSRSDLLWRRLTRRIWGQTILLRDRWRDEYVYWHRTATNFRTQRSTHTTLYFDPSGVEDPDGLTCRCLTLSDAHLACGFADGTVRLFDLATRLHVSTFRPQPRDRLGRFSRAVTGIVITDSTLIFAMLDGDIHVAIINGPQIARRAHLGDVVNDGVLVDFTGSERWWVGLYAGVPGRAFHIWNGLTEQLTFVGGTLTDQEALMGWHMLTEMTEFVGRVRVTSWETAVACTSARVIVFDLRNQGFVLSEEEYRRGIIVTAADVSRSAFVIVGRRGLANVRRTDTLEEVCRFIVSGASQMAVMGCMNEGYALMCGGGVVRVWEVERGAYLDSFMEMIGEVNAFVCDERHVAACSGGTTLHLWDFGAAD